MEEVMLTTFDNPYNPFVEYDAWLAYDLLMGHNTNNYLARVVVTSNELSVYDQELAINQGMREIVELNPTGFWRLIGPNEKPVVIQLT